MKTTEIFQPIYLQEDISRNIPLIVVDVQPAYESWIVRKFPPSYLADVMNRHQGPILMFVNADEQGMTEDTKASVFNWWYDNGLEESTWKRPNFTYYDKGYGYLRDWMDYGKSPRVIIQSIRFMFQMGETDSREFFYYPGDYDVEVGEKFREIAGNEWAPWMEDSPLIVNWVGIDLLRRHSGYICGGGRDECLREITLMMNAFNIKYKMLERFVYG